MISFGENDLFCQLHNPPESKLRRCQNKLQKIISFAPVPFFGRLFVIPHQKPINTIGKHWYSWNEISILAIFILFAFSSNPYQLLIMGDLSIVVHEYRTIESSGSCMLVESNLTAPEILATTSPWLCPILLLLRVQNCRLRSIKSLRIAPESRKVWIQKDIWILWIRRTKTPEKFSSF